jgi:hypothetical protein
MSSNSWVVLAKYPSIFEAERVKATLESAGIPTMVQSHGVGVFGPGYQGPAAGGASVLVPSPALDQAWDVVVERT